MNVKFFLKVCMICFVMFACSVCICQEVKAEEDIMYEDEYLDLNGVDEESQQDKKAEIRRIGQAARRCREVYTITMTKYMQTDSAWRNVQLTADTEDTIGNVGCYLTSFAMVANYYEPLSGWNPLTIFQSLGSAVCPFNPWNVATGMGYTVSTYTTAEELATNAMNDTVCGAISEGYPVMIVVRKSNGDNHCVVARGYSETTHEIYILDPGSSTINKLSDYLNNGAQVINMMIFYE